MGNYDNIKDKGFDKRSTEEVRKIASRGGIASGRARRQKADFRRMLNMLLTSNIPIEDANTRILTILGIEPTYEAAVNLAMIRAAMQGDSIAYSKIAKLAGQSEITRADEQEQKIRIDRAKNMREIEKTGGYVEDESIKAFLEAIKPDEIELKELFNENAEKTE